MLEKKKEHGKGLSEVEKNAKMHVAGALQKMASDAMRSKGLKKVSVASNSSEGLKEGLDEAKHKVEDMSEDHSAPVASDEDGEIVPPGEGHEMLEDAENGYAHGSDMLSGGGHGLKGDDRLQDTIDDEDDEDEAMEDGDHSDHADAEDDEDEEELDRKLKHLMDKKEKMKSKKKA